MAVAITEADKERIEKNIQDGLKTYIDLSVVVRIFQMVRLQFLPKGNMPLLHIRRPLESNCKGKARRNL